MIVTPARIKALNVTFNRQFQDGIKSADNTYKTVASVVPSSGSANVYGWLGQFPQMEQWIGRRVIRDMTANSYIVQNILYTSTLSVARTDIEDDQIGIYGPLFKQQGQEAEQYPNREVFKLLKDGDNKLCYDGQNFFDTDHPVYPNTDGNGDPTPVSNYFAGEAGAPAWYLMDTTQVLKPLIFQERIKPQITNKTSDTTSDEVYMGDVFLYGIRARSGAGYGLWQLCVKSTKPLNAENYEEAYQALSNMKKDGGDVRVNQASELTIKRGVPFVLSWTHRNRVIQSNNLVAHNEASIAPEAGTAYLVRLYRADELVREISVAGDSWRYPEPPEAQWEDFDSLALYTSRDGLESWQGYRLPVV